MTASVPMRASFKRPWTSRACPTMTMPFPLHRSNRELKRGDLPPQELRAHASAAGPLPRLDEFVQFRHMLPCRGFPRCTLTAVEPELEGAGRLRMAGAKRGVADARLDDGFNHLQVRVLMLSIAAKDVMIGRNV